MEAELQEGERRPSPGERVEAELQEGKWRPCPGERVEAELQEGEWRPSLGWVDRSWASRPWPGRWPGKVPLGPTGAVDPGRADNISPPSLSSDEARVTNSIVLLRPS